MVAVFMFPGQGSQDAGMLCRARSVCAAATDILSVASETLGRDLEWHYRSDNPRAFETNRDVQVGLFVANHLFMVAVEERGITAELSLGMSLGEYNHLVHIGALQFEDALRLVDARGAAYDRGPHGAMLSVFPLAIDDVETLIRRARAVGLIELANLNSPTQYVLSGERGAIDRAMRIVEDEYYAEARLLDVALPMHTSLFAPVAAAFEPALVSADWHRPAHPYLPNLRGTFLEAPTRADFVTTLTAHVHRPVQWRASIDRVAAQAPAAWFVQVGPRSALYSLLGRHWHGDRRLRTDDARDVATAVALAVETLRRDG